MKKKLISLCAVVALAAVAVGGTLAYFTDADKDVNVMTAGNVKIVQNETERDGSAYVDDQKLVPAVYNGEIEYDGTMNDTDGTGTIAIFDESVENEIDKVISVTNKGTEPAYIRTIVLFENDAESEICGKIHTCEHQEIVRVTDAQGNEIQVEIGDVNYSIGVATYADPVAAGATTSPSLMQVFVDPTAGNEWTELLEDGKLNIIAISQAVQSQGFDDAATALNTAFGEVTAANVADWYAKTATDTTGEANVIA